MDSRESTSLRVTVETRDAMRLAANEAGVRKGKIFSSDDERIMSLVDHWNATKDVAEVQHGETCG